MTARPTHVLRHEHRVIEKALRALEGICLRLRTGGDIPAEALLQVLDFIQNFADRFHHAREEEYLFPALEQSGLGKEGGALDFLQEEHRIERQLLTELELAVAGYRAGNTEASRRFVDSSDRFCKHLIGHMQREDTLLFRIAEEMLDEGSKTHLMRNLTRKDSEDSEDAGRKYELLAAELEKDWAI